jgi:hypothetical protein
MAPFTTFDRCCSLAEETLKHNHADHYQKRLVSSIIFAFPPISSGTRARWIRPFFLVSALLSPVTLCCKKADRARRPVGGDLEILQGIYDGVPMTLWVPCAVVEATEVACPTAKVPPAAIDKDVALTMGRW